MKMTTLPLIYLDTQRLCGSHEGGWQVDLGGEGGLPTAADLLQRLPTSAFSSRQTALLIEDGLLFPLRIQLEQTVKGREVVDFLKWKLKRLLPYPIDQVQIRYVALQEENTYLTFSLPQPWVDTIYDKFSEAGVHLGYVGGLFSSLLENAPVLRGGVNIAFFRDMYLIAELDARGQYLRFHSRRVPFDGQGTVDLRTVLNVDLQPLFEQHPGPIRLMNLAPELAISFPELIQRAGDILAQCTGLPTQELAATSTPLDRFCAIADNQGGER